MRKEIGFLYGKFFAKLGMIIDEEIKNFIKENKYLIQNGEWEEIYQKDFPFGFTETLLDCGINPLAQGLNYIPRYFLYDCKNIKEFIIPGNVTSIGEDAFNNCTSLTRVIIDDNVTSIGTAAFHSCKSLTSVTIGDSVTSIGTAAFSDCTSLQSIEIPNSVTSIGWHAFSECESLTSVIISNSVISIGKYVFYYCSSLTNINYLGTKKEAIELGIGDKPNKKWRENSNIEKIICTDGEIIL